MSLFDQLNLASKVALQACFWPFAAFSLGFAYLCFLGFFQTADMFPLAYLGLP